MYRDAPLLRWIWITAALSSGATAVFADVAALRGDVVASTDIAIEEHSAYWTDLLGLVVALAGAGADDDQPPMLIIRGKLRNAAPTPIDHVRLAFELLDNSGTVVFTELGYNHRAEALQPIDGPAPWISSPDEKIEPIPAGGGDSFRVILLGRDIPHFDSYRVRVLESAPVAATD